MIELTGLSDRVKILQNDSANLDGLHCHLILEDFRRYTFIQEVGFKTNLFTKSLPRHLPVRKHDLQARIQIHQIDCWHLQTCA